MGTMIINLYRVICRVVGRATRMDGDGGAHYEFMAKNLRRGIIVFMVFVVLDSSGD